jgi:DNA repair protein RadC
MNYFRKYKLVVEETTEYAQKKYNASHFIFNKAKDIIGTDINVREHMLCFFLDSQCNLTGYSTISIGMEELCSISLKQLATLAFLSTSTRVVLLHNHPSGSNKPSDSDKSVTREVKKSLAMLDIKLLDHLVITKDSYYSMHDEGELYEEANQ